MNSKGGDPKSLYDSGSFNCWDGANIMLAMASEFGLSGHIATGMWGNTPHAWAVIGGQPFDTTARQDGYGWTSPKVNYAGGVSIKTPTQMDQEPIQFDGTLTHEHNINLTGIPENVDPEMLKEIFEDMTKENPQFVKGFVSQNAFMEYLSIELARRKGKTNRTYG